MDTTLNDRIQELLAPILTSRELEVMEIAWHGSKLQITLDRDTGNVGIDDCTEASRFLSHALDVEDLIPGRYTLEVSSPGLDRPLRDRRDFERFTGHLCRVHVEEPVNGNHVLVGRIEAVDEDGVRLETDRGECTVAHDNVTKARLEVEI